MNGSALPSVRNQHGHQGLATAFGHSSPPTRQKGNLVDELVNFLVQLTGHGIMEVKKKNMMDMEG
jgi:hypothetical protein